MRISIVMIYKFILLFSLLVLIPSYFTFPFFSPVTGQTPGSLTITNVQVTPTFPQPNEPIHVQATILHSFNLEYARLSWSNDTIHYYNITLTETGSQQFKAVIPGQPASTTLTFFIDVKDINGESARWPEQQNYEITIGDQNTPLPTPLHHNVSLSPGIRMLNVSSAGVILELHLNRSLELSVDLVSGESLNTSYRVIQAISSVISVTVNDTAALDYALLQFIINPGKALKHGLLETHFTAYTRKDNTSSWQPYSASINFQRRVAIVNVTHFSEWVIASSDPILELDVKTSTTQVILNQEFKVTTITKNLGGSTLQNISLQVFHVESILVTSGFEQALLPSLEGNSEKTLTWTFIPKETGEYTLVFVATAGSNYSISQTLSFTVLRETGTTTSQSPLPVFSLLSCLSLIIVALWHKRTSN